MELIAWLGLITSWLGVVLLLKFVFLVLRVLKQTRRLAQMTRDAAVHLGDNLSEDAAFAELAVLAAQLPGAVGALARGAGARPNVSSLSPGIRGGFPS